MFYTRKHLQYYDIVWHTPNDFFFYSFPAEINNCYCFILHNVFHFTLHFSFFRILFHRFIHGNIGWCDIFTTKDIQKVFILSQTVNTIGHFRREILNFKFFYHNLQKCRLGNHGGKTKSPRHSMLLCNTKQVIAFSFPFGIFLTFVSIRSGKHRNLSVFGILSAGMAIMPFRR